MEKIRQLGNEFGLVKGLNSIEELKRRKVEEELKRKKEGLRKKKKKN